MIVDSDDPVDNSSDFELLDLDDNGGDSDKLTKRQRAIFKILYCKNEAQESEEDETLGINFTSCQLQPWSHA
jgi:hypothetical protein